jgi:hypothetical protein
MAQIDAHQSRLFTLPTGLVRMGTPITPLKARAIARQNLG